MEEIILHCSIATTVSSNTLQLILKTSTMHCQWNDMLSTLFVILFLFFWADTMCNSRKYPYLPHGRDFFYHLPTPLEIPRKLHTSLYIFLIFQIPPSPRKFQSLLWGGVWIFSWTAQCTMMFFLPFQVLLTVILCLCFYPAGMLMPSDIPLPGPLPGQV